MQRSCGRSVFEVLRADKVARATVAGARGTVRQQERQNTEGILQRTVAFPESEMGVPVGFAEVGFQELGLLCVGNPRPPVLRTEFIVPAWGREVTECSVLCWKELSPWGGSDTGMAVKGSGLGFLMQTEPQEFVINCSQA